MRTPLFTANSHFSDPARWLSAIVVLLAVLGLSFTTQAQENSSINGSSIIVDRGQTGGNVGNQTYDGRTQTDAPNFEGANLGTFDVEDFNTTLLLNGGTLSTTQSDPDDIRSAILFYEVTKRPGGAPTNGRQQIGLSAPSNPSGAKTFLANMGNADLLAGSGSGGRLAPGDYYIEVTFLASGFNAAEDRSFDKPDPGNSTYRARFTVSGIRPNEPNTSTTWRGGKNDDWFDVANWSNGLPTATKDATIPDFGSGSTVQYPNIYSNAVKPNTIVTTTVRNPDGTTSVINTEVPGYDNSKSGPAETRNFVMIGTSQAQRSISRLIVGRLNVFGNFSNEQDSFIQRENTIISFKGTTQSISGSTSGFVNIEIDGGGVKRLINNFKIQSGGTLRFINGVLKTDSSRVATNFIELAPSTSVGGVGVPSARILGETETSYLRGFVTISEVAQVGVPQDFGNIGAILTFNGNSPGIVTVTRNTAQNYASINNGVNSEPSIRRIFGVRPTDQQTNSGGLSATFQFRYLDNEIRNLFPNRQSLDESKFALFVSASGGNTFGQSGRDALNTETNTLTKNNVTTFATFTLSEFTSPLPVTLIAFDAKRVGANAEITWKTASEIDNQGYEVQVSDDGRTFRKLAFIPSYSANSNRLMSYRYEDTEANKTGIRYYRLRQIDLDGTDHYYAPRVLTFDGIKSAKNTLQGFPNPFDNELYLTASTTTAGKGQLSLTDLTGRVVAQHAMEMTSGTNKLTIPNVATLQSGVYLLRLVMPTGESQTLRVSKK